MLMERIVVINIEKHEKRKKTWLKVCRDCTEHADVQK